MFPNIFNYSNPRGFLVDSFEAIKRSNPNYSVRAWSLKMGFKGHTSLLFLMNGSRKIRPQHIPNILRGIRLSDLEQLYFQSLVHLVSSENPSDKALYERVLQDLHPSKKFSYLELDQFRVISDWQHMAILEMVALEDFKNDSRWISKRLGKKISSNEEIFLAGGVGIVPHFLAGAQGFEP